MMNFSANTNTANPIKPTIQNRVRARTSTLPKKSSKLRKINQYHESQLCPKKMFS
jgi:hypothetical protein